MTYKNSRPIQYALVRSVITSGLILFTTFAIFFYGSSVFAQEISPDRARQIDQAVPDQATVEPAQPRRVLVFISPPHRMPDDPHKGYCIPYGSYAFQKLGEKTGAYEAVVSDDLAMFLPAQINQFDAIVLNNASGDWVTPTEAQLNNPAFQQLGSDAEAIETALRESLLAFVRDGRGLMGVHYAMGANRNWPEFAQLMGASMDGHPWNEEVGIKLDEPDHPLSAAFGGEDFRLAEEIFQFRDPYSRERNRVLLSLDVPNTNMEVPWINRTDGDFALAWTRSEGEGRIFYTAIGHRTEHYWNPTLLRFYLDGVQFCTGDLEAPSKPIVENATSDEETELGFTSLFNGKDLTGWSGDESIWSVQEGLLTGQTNSATHLDYNDFLIWEDGRPSDFELRLEFKLVGGNSGIYFHGEPQPEGEPLIGPQADFSADHRWTGVLMEWRKRDVLAERGQRVEIDANGLRQVVGDVGDPDKLLEFVHDEDWNEYVLSTNSGRTVLKINGTTMCEINDKDPRRTPAGILALQVHKGPPMTVQFRNIRIRED